MLLAMRLSKCELHANELVHPSTSIEFVIANVFSEEENKKITKVIMLNVEEWFDFLCDEKIISN